jgi:hypothetical protein
MEAITYRSIKSILQHGLAGRQLRFGTKTPAGVHRRVTSFSDDRVLVGTPFS